MTVESTITKAIYHGNGAASLFPVPFAYSETDSVLLTFTDAAGKNSLVASNYRIDVDESGGTSVVYPVSGRPIPAGTRLAVYRNTPLTQIVDLIYGGAFSPDTLEHDGFDRIVMMIQELQEELDRAVKVAISSEQSPEDLLTDIFEARDEAVSSAERAENAADIAEDAAGSACASARDAAESAREAAETVKEIPGFSNNVMAFFGLYVDDSMRLVCDRTENGDVMDMEAYPYAAWLPARCAFSINNSGRLALTDPYAASAIKRHC